MMAVHNHGTYRLQNGEETPFVEAMTHKALTQFLDQNRRTLREIFLPDLTVVHDKCFEDCSALVSVKMPKVNLIRSYAFFCCSNLQFVDMPMVMWIDEGAFESCINLQSVNLRVQRIGKGAFESCINLQSVNLPVVKKVDEMAFQHCINLTSVDMPAVEEIGEFAFQSCINLQSVNLPVVKKIGEFAFQYCIRLASASMPEHVTFEETVFDHCWLLPSAEVFDNDGIDPVDLLSLLVETPQTDHGYGRYQLLCEKDVCFFDEDMTPEALTQFVAQYRHTLREICLPNIREVPESCFENCSALVSVKIPAVKIIHASAFENCSNLQSVDMPLVERVEFCAFRFCVSLKSVDLPKAVTIKDSAFEVCFSLTSVKVPMAENIGRDAFSTCVALEKIDMPTVARMGGNAFEGCFSLVFANMPVVTTLEPFRSNNVEEVCTFAHCFSLAMVVAPQMIVTQGMVGSMLEKCHGLKQVVFASELDATFMSPYLPTVELLTPKQYDDSNNQMISELCPNRGDRADLDVLDSHAFHALRLLYCCHRLHAIRVPWDFLMKHLSVLKFSRLRTIFPELTRKVLQLYVSLPGGNQEDEICLDQALKIRDVVALRCVNRRAKEYLTIFPTLAVGSQPCTATSFSEELPGTQEGRGVKRSRDDEAGVASSSAPQFHATA